MQKGSWYTPMENLTLYYFLSRICKENPHLVKPLVPQNYLSLIFLARHALSALLYPWRDTEQPSLNWRRKHKSKEKGMWTDQTILLPNDLWGQTHQNKLCNLKHMVRWRQKSMIIASGVYADQCIITALVAISESVMKRKDVLGLLLILIIPVRE